MPTVLHRSSVLFSIAEQKLGFEFGKPERVNQESLSVVLPILRHTTTPRSYTTFPETDTLKVTDSGSIDTMNAKNTGELAVFLRSGTIFKGSTQERASLRSMIVLAGEQVGIKVRCIHQSRGISMGAKTDYGGVTPLMMDQLSYGATFAPRDQHQYWMNARTVSASMSSMSGKTASRSADRLPRYSTLHERRRDYSDVLMASSSLGSTAGADDLHSEMADFNKTFDDVLSRVNLVDDQVGLGLITDRGCETIEIFDAHDSWKALHGDAIKRLGPNMASKDKASVFEYKPEKAVEVVRQVLALPFTENLIYEHKPNNGDPAFSVLGLSAENYTGEVVEFDGKVIHLMILKLGIA